MKRSFLLLFIVAWLLTPGWSPAADKAGDVVYLKGRAEIERQAKKLGAKLKDQVLETDNVVTKERSRAKLLFRDDSIITLGANSKLVVKQYLYNPESKRVESIYELADGKLKAVVGSGGFKVTTPTAFAAARGTVFVIWYDRETDTTGIAVIEGEVEIKNIKEGVAGALVLTAGQMSTISGSDAPKAVQPFDAAVMDRGGVSGKEGVILSELFETSAPEVVMPMERLEQIKLELMEQAGSPAAPPIDQQPSAVSTRVGLDVVFP